ncbi:MAG: right-handed parallel beta-helix repeat-containing protein [Methanobrevibacter sp.]|nr:right-handed parallel beta-helix repeat-containing protein [Methanobrevibacter sp.]
MVLFTIASVNASDVNDAVVASVNANNVNGTVMASEDQDNEVVLAENQVSEELSATEENKLSADVGTFTNLATEIKKADNELNLTRDYAYTAPIGYRETDVIYVDGIPVNKKITINGNGFTIDGKNMASAFFIFNTTNPIVLNNITFKNCYTPSIGGAIFSNGEHVIISNCRFIDNTAKESGGAIQIVGDNSIISNCTFINNKAPIGGALVTTDKCTIINCTFTNNNADKGGAVLNGKQNLISNCIFTNNSAKLGGAIWAQDPNSTIRNCIFTNNVAKEEGGAVCSASDCINLVVSNSTFTNNKADDGGALLFYAQTTVSDCSFTNNTANNAGAIWVQGINSTVKNCNFTNNTALNVGGAIFGQENRIDLVVSNSTFTNNKATDGGALLFLAQTTVSDCSFTNNTANNAGAIWVQGINSTVKNCNFTNNTAAEDGGAIYEDKNCIDLVVSNSTFTNNNATDGGAMVITSPATVSDCSFINNNASNSAGAIWIENKDSTIMNCRFTNNIASKRAGAIIMTSTAKNCSVKNCNFTNNAAKEDGGAISWDDNNNGNVEHCYFNNNAADQGGAMYGGTAVNCSFINNNVYNTITQFNVKDKAVFMESIVMFYGLPECTLTVTATDKNGVAKTFECSDKGWNIGNLKVGTYTVKFTIKQYDENSGEFTTQIDVKTKQIQELDELIHNTQNDTIVLDYDYCCYDKGDLANGIIINKSVTIDGQGHKIDGNKLMRIFQVNNNAEVTFKNIIFANGQAKYGGFGAAIWNNGAKSVTATNCTFESNTASYGGAVSNVNALSCSFNNNSASGFGGAMWGGSAVNCSFIDNTAKYGGAMQKVNYAHNCSFINNSASDLGGAMNGGNAVNCTFVNNSASTGSAIYTGSADNCTFVANNAYYTDIKFYINYEDIMFAGDVVSFQGLPECNLKVTATKEGVSKEFICTNAGWKIENLELGIYNVQFNIEDNYNRGKVNTVMQLGYELDLTLNVVDIFTGQNEIVEIFATNKTFTDNVTLSINDTIYTINVVNGYGSYAVPDLAIGEYNATVSFKGDKFWPVEKSVQFEVASKFDLDLTITVEDIIESQNETVIIHTIDIFNGNVTLSINGINNSVEILNGVGNYTIGEMDIGNYTVTVSFDGNVGFNADSKQAKFAVLPKQNLNLTVSVEDIEEGNNTTICIIANPLFDGEVKISINGTDIQNDTFELIDGKGSYIAMLDAGNYTVTVSYDGGATFNPDSNSTTFEVKSEREKTDLDMTVTVDNIHVGDNATVKVTTNNTFNGKLILIIEGVVNDDINITNGEGSYTLENLSAGNYTAYVAFNGDDTFKADAKSSMFEVEKHDLDLTASVDDIFEGQTETVQIHTTYLFNGNVTLLIDDNNYTVAIAEGSGSYDASGLAVGNHTITVVYDGNYKFHPDEKSVQFEVTPKFDLDLTISVADIIEGQNETVEIHAIDLFDGNVTLSINGISNSVEILNGVGNYALGEMDAGNYTVTVSFDGNEGFNADSKSAKFEVVPKQDLNLTVTVSDIDEGDMAAIYISTNPLFDGDVRISISGTDIQNEILDIIEGKCTYHAMYLDSGNYTVTVSYDGNYAFNPDLKSAEFEVKPEKEKTDLNLTVSVADIFEGQNAVVKVRTNDTFTGDVMVLIRGLFNGNMHVVNGAGSISIKDLSEGSYNVYAGFNGDDSFKADVTVFRFDVKPAVYKIINNKNVAMLYTAKSPYKVLITKNGKAVGAGESVKIRFNGKTYTVKTDKNGYAVFKIPNVKPKKAKYVITASYKGKTVKNTVKVKSIIKAKNKKVKKSKKVTKIKVSLKKVNRKYLKNKKIKIKFKGKTYKVKTNKKGVATWKVKKSMLKKLKVGKKYKYKVTYGKDTVTKKLTIKR